MSDLLRENLLSPMILCFLLGILARVFKSDLKIPADLYTALTIFLLLAIGLKGGSELSQSDMLLLWKPLTISLLIGIVTPILSFTLLMASNKFSSTDAASLAAHYGSVSAVTFIAAQDFVVRSGHPPEGFMPALLAFLECPGIFVSLALGLTFKTTRSASLSTADCLRDLRRTSWEVLTSKSMVLLIGGLVIGFIVGPESMQQVKPFFIDNFRGVLCLFLLELGLIVAGHLDDLKKAPCILLAFATCVPLGFGLLGVWLGHHSGLGIGGAAVLGSMAASASYIAAPPAVRAALPEANLPLALTAALVITFPFNLVIGIPLYLKFSLWMGL